MIQIKLKHFFILVALLVAFTCGVYVKSIFTPSIAVVNLEQVLEQSPKLNAIRKDNEVKLNELTQWIDEVNKEIDAETDAVKHQKLANQYRKLTSEKEKVIKQEYNNRLKEVDAEITALIDRVAKQHGCNFVFANTSMVTGGKDITDDVIKELK